MQCPACRGRGKIIVSMSKHENAASSRARVAANRETALRLRESGMSIRKIMNRLGYKSPQAIQYLLGYRRKKAA